MEFVRGAHLNLVLSFRWWEVPFISKYLCSELSVVFSLYLIYVFVGNLLTNL